MGTCISGQLFVFHENIYNKCNKKLTLTPKQFLIGEYHQGEIQNLNDDDDDALCEPSEDEYDALNDETFGTIGSNESDDWELAHEQLAQITENGRKKHQGECHDVEASLSQLVLDDSSDYVKNDRQHQTQQSIWNSNFNSQANIQSKNTSGMKVCTVEELERSLRQQPQQQQQTYFPPRFPLSLPRPSVQQGPPPTTQLPHFNNQQNGQMGSQFIAQNQYTTNAQNNNTQFQPFPGQFTPFGQFGPNNGQFGPNNGQFGPNNTQFGQNNGQFGPNNGQFGPNKTQFGPNNGQFGPNFPLTGPQHRTVGPPPSGPPRPNFFGPFNPQNIRLPQQDLKKNSEKVPKPRLQSQPQSQQPQMQFPTHNKPLTSQSLVQMIQSNHPMLNNGLSSGLHNASQHPLLNRTVYNRNYQHQNGSMEDTQHEDLELQDQDEFSGLMTSREKQWLLNIQMLQLSTGTPYIHDYYYTVFTDRKRQKEKEDVNEAHAANQKNHPFYSGDKRQQPRERHNSGHRHSNSEEQQPRIYVPTQFENSLGKLQSSSVTAPRKIIDVEVVAGDVNSNATGRVSRATSVCSTTETPREGRRIKTLLLDIEALFCVLLRLEELRKPLAIADAIVLKEREEKQRQLEAAIKELENADSKSNDSSNNMYSSIQQRHKMRDSPPLDKRQVVSVVPSGPQTVVAKNLLDENKEELINKMFNGLLFDDKLKYILAVRKGRALLVRFLRCLESDQQSQTVSARLRSLWTHTLRALPRLSRRSDALMNQLFPSFRRYIWQSNGWSTILECSFALNQALDPARSPVALSVPLTLSCVCALLEKADTLVQATEGSASERNWMKFLKNLARTLKNCKSTIAEPLEPLAKNLVAEHVKVLESRGTVEILKRGSLAGEFADLDRSDLSKQLLQHLC